MKQREKKHGAVPKETSKQTGRGAGTNATPGPKSAVCGETADSLMSCLQNWVHSDNDPPLPSLTFTHTVWGTVRRG